LGRVGWTVGSVFIGLGVLLA